MKTNDRHYEDPALREALGRIGDEVNDGSLPDGFEERVMGKMVVPHHTRRLYRVAAAFIGVLMLSGIAWAAWQSRGQSAGAGQEPPTSAVGLQPVETTGDVVRFDNVQFDSVLNVVAGHYHKQVEFCNEAVRTLHFHVEWNKVAPLTDFITLINNFEGISLRQEQDTIIVE